MSHDDIGQVYGKSLIDPLLGGFVGAKDSVIPGVHQFVHGYPDQTVERSIAGDEGSHDVLHPPITPLNDYILIVRVDPVVFVHEFEGACRVFRKLFPVFEGRSVFVRVGLGFIQRVGLIVEPQEWSVLHGVGDLMVVGIGCPHKIVHGVGHKVPGGFCDGVGCFVHPGCFVYPGHIIHSRRFTQPGCFIHPGRFCTLQIPGCRHDVRESRVIFTSNRPKGA